MAVIPSNGRVVVDYRECGDFSGKAQVHLRDSAGAIVPAKQEVVENAVVLTPREPLKPGADYTVVDHLSFESLALVVSEPHAFATLRATELSDRTPPVCSSVTVTALDLRSGSTCSGLLRLDWAPATDDNPEGGVRYIIRDLDRPSMPPRWEQAPPVFRCVEDLQRISVSAVDASGNEGLCGTEVSLATPSLRVRAHPLETVLSILVCIAFGGLVRLLVRRRSRNPTRGERT